MGTKGVHLDVQQRINKTTVVTPTNSLPTYLSAPTQAQLDALPITLCPAQLQTCFEYRANGVGPSNILPAIRGPGFSQTEHLLKIHRLDIQAYNGLAIQLNRRFSNGLQFQGAYTWSHLIDNSTADFNTTRALAASRSELPNLTAEKATSALDRRQRLTIAAYYESQWFKKGNWMMKNLAGNWVFAPIYTYESPELFTVESQVDSNLNGDSATDRVIVNPAGVAGTGSGVTALTNSSGQTVAYLATNPKAQYI